MKVHIFGAASSPSCCSFAIQQTAEDNKNYFDAQAIQTVIRNFYVDDCLKSVENDLIAIILVRQLRQLLAKGGFRLTKWLSNSRRVLEAIPETERAATIKNLNLEDLPIERALGIHWNIKIDVIGYNVTIKSRPHTRRGLLSILTSIYDPLGIAMLREVFGHYHALRGLWALLCFESFGHYHASRGLSADNFLSCVRWIKGPKFVSCLPETWPKRPNGFGEVLSDDPEIRKDSITCIAVKDEGVRAIDSIIKHFSLWIRLKKFIAWVLRFKRNLLEAYRKLSNGNSVNDHKQITIKPITVAELKIAERELLKHMQKTNFFEELKSCRVAVVSTNKPVRGVKKTSSIFRLDPVLIDGLLRVGAA